MLRVRKSLEGDGGCAWWANTLTILPFQALLPGLLARMILEVRCPRLAPVLLLEVACCESTWRGGSCL